MKKASLRSRHEKKIASTGMSHRRVYGLGIIRHRVTVGHSPQVVDWPIIVSLWFLDW